jgi:membrane-bound lytic murein transglycosylase D
MRNVEGVTAAPARWSTVRTGLVSRFAGAAAVAAVAVLSACTLASAAPSPGSTHFPRYKELEPNVAFWSDVFTKWTSKQIAYHDVEHLELIYSVLNLDDIIRGLPGAQQEEAIKARRKAEGERITAMLLRISDGHARTEEERRILKAIAKIGHEASYAAKLSEQVRSQRGLGDRFCDAAQRAEAYRPMMSRILKSYDVPQELLALPLVESGYKIGARSHAGASGIWQFMPATGRLYMTVSDTYDDRRDPVRATDAAARMLRRTYDNIGTWPLAITSYNHGPGGVARAVREMGTTHFGVISRHYKGKAFGFASRNYYAEFLAAVDAMQHLEDFCGKITVPPYEVDEVTLSAAAPIGDLARAAGISVTQLDDLNPALSDSVVRGKTRVPRGYRLNLPPGSRNAFAANFRHIDRTPPTAPTMLARAKEYNEPATTPDEPALAPRKHKVAKGESLGQIARRYGTTETTLIWMNTLANAKAIKVGQTIKVPGDRTSQAVAVATATVPKPPLSGKMTTTAGVIAAKEAGAIAARAASTAAGTAVAAVPAAVIQADKDPIANAAPSAAAQNGAPSAAAQNGAPSAAAQNGAPSAAAQDGAASAAAGEPAPPVEVKDVPVSKREPAESATAEDAEPVLTAEHKVGRGQTLSQIASMYRTSVDDLKRMNDIKDVSSVQAGQVLKVKASGSQIVAGATVGHTYKAKPGDTLWTIARTNDTSVETLKRLNPKLASKGLLIGDTIKVPSAGAVSVASKSVKADTAKASKSSEKKVVTSAARTPAKASAKTSSSSKTASKSSKAVPKDSFRSHKVQKGQTLTSIAQRYKTSVDTLKRINGIRDAKAVQAGKTLKVPL